MVPDNQLQAPTGKDILIFDTLRLVEVAALIYQPGYSQPTVHQQILGTCV